MNLETASTRCTSKDTSLDMSATARGANKEETWERQLRRSKTHASSAGAKMENAEEQGSFGSYHIDEREQRIHSDTKKMTGTK